MSAQLPPLYRVVPQGSFAVWIQEDLFAPDALEAILTTRVSASDTARAHRTTTKFQLHELIDVAIARNSGNHEMGHAARLVDVECIVPRGQQRWDLRLTDLWVRRMREVNVAFRDACALADEVKRMHCKGRKTRIDWHVQRVLPGSPDQPLHVDDQNAKLGARCYYTLIVPLTDNPRSGGTSFPKLGTVFARYGGAVCFDGTVEHAGLGNRSQQDRHFLYAAIYTGKDVNC